MHLSFYQRLITVVISGYLLCYAAHASELQGDKYTSETSINHTTTNPISYIKPHAYLKVAYNQPDPIVDKKSRETPPQDKDTEQADAEKVNTALEYVQKNDLAAAEVILSDVCSRAPDEYQYEYVKDGKRYIKFWDQQQFITYIAMHKEGIQEDIIWLMSAYPRACFYLGYVLVEKEDWTNALRWLVKGVKMEPRNPHFYTEIGLVLGDMKLGQEAIDSYQKALDLAVETGAYHVQAVALRGMGVQLIELGRLDEAENYIKKSLELEPNNALAENELQYIAHLRKNPANPHYPLTTIRSQDPK